jgi:hypothetical protein
MPQDVLQRSIEFRQWAESSMNLVRQEHSSILAVVVVLVASPYFSDELRFAGTPLHRSLRNSATLSTGVSDACRTRPFWHGVSSCKRMVSRVNVPKEMGAKDEAKWERQLFESKPSTRRNWSHHLHHSKVSSNRNSRGECS